MKSLSRVRLFASPWSAAYQAPPSMGFSRQEYWSGLHTNIYLYLHIYVCLYIYRERDVYISIYVHLFDLLVLTG